MIKFLENKKREMDLRKLKILESLKFQGEEKEA